MATLGAKCGGHITTRLRSCDNGDADVKVKHQKVPKGVILILAYLLIACYAIILL